MAKQYPGLVTGSNAKLRFGSKTLAYATDVSYSVDVSVVPVEVMGRYEVIANEPIATNVRGTFTIVRYTKAGNAGLYESSKESGNGVGALGREGKAKDTGQANAFNPGQMLSTSTVDLEIFQRSSTGGNIETTTAMVKISDCRLTRLSSGLSKRGIMTETYDFVGVLYGDESFDAKLSGSGEDLT